MEKTSKAIPLYVQIFVAMVVGIVVGLCAGKDAAPLGEMSKIIINLIKVFATPLLFFAILEAVAMTHLGSKATFYMLAISAINTALAIVVGLSISNTLEPGVHLANIVAGAKAGNPVEQINFMKAFVGYFPTSIMQPFVENSLIPIILVAILLGFALRSVMQHEEENGLSVTGIKRGLNIAYRTNERVLSWIVKLVPVAVAFALAKTAGEHGLAAIVGLSYYVLAGILGLLIHVLLVYQAWIVLVAKMPLRVFWSGIKDAIFNAVGVSSSLATLPVTLRCLKNMGISDRSSRLACCVGTNFNNDGILLYEAMATLFVAQAYGIKLTIGQQILTAVSCAVAGIGIAGVPEAGLISLSLVLATVGLPTELLPILISVDWILSRARATTNVISDAVVSILLEKTR